VSLRVVIELAGPPRGKGRPRATVNRRTGFAQVYTDDKTAKYEAQLRFAAQQEMAGRLPTAQPIRVTVEARFAVPQSWSRRARAAALCGHTRPTTTPDADNLLKTLDSLNGVVWVDDRQIVDGVIRKVYAEAPGLIVTVETITPPALPVISSDPAPGPTHDLFAMAGA
jgi:Holliday junction resolvase RusA-like endonuclease